MNLHHYHPHNTFEEFSFTLQFIFYSQLRSSSFTFHPSPNASHPHLRQSPWVSQWVRHTQHLANTKIVSTLSLPLCFTSDPCMIYDLHIDDCNVKIWKWNIKIRKSKIQKHKIKGLQKKVQIKIDRKLENNKTLSYR